MNIVVTENVGYLSVKGTGTQRRTKRSPWYLHCTYCGWQKGTYRDEVTSNSDRITPVALSIVKTESIS